MFVNIPSIHLDREQKDIEHISRVGKVLESKWVPFILVLVFVYYSIGIGIEDVLVLKLERYWRAPGAVGGWHPS